MQVWKSTGVLYKWKWLIFQIVCQMGYLEKQKIVLEKQKIVPEKQK